MKVSMVFILTNGLVFFIFLNGAAQVDGAKNPRPNNDWCFKRTKPLTIYAYKRMMREHYNFTIMGSQAPVSGFKIETNKPTLTLKGNINSPKNDKGLLVNIELTGGIRNDLMQIFSGDELNGYFKASVGFNKLIDRGNKAKYLIEDEFMKYLLDKKVCSYREEVSRQIDTFLILSTLETFRSSELRLQNFSEFVVVVEDKSMQDHYGIDKWVRLYPDNAPRKYYETLVVEVLKYYGAEKDATDPQKWFVEFLQALNNDQSMKLQFVKLVNDYHRLKIFQTDNRHKYDLIDADEINTYKDVWTSKRISWINVSLSAANESFKSFDPLVSFETILNRNSFLPSISVAYNYFWKASVTNQYFFIRSGVTGKRVNTLVDLKTFDYIKEDVINVTPTESLKSKKTGTAYQGAFDEGYGFEFPVEIYWAPWKTVAIPGVYSKLSYNYGAVWINKSKLGLDLGLVWNVLNNDKDAKNVLTIVPYMNWSNLFTEYKDRDKTAKREPSELFSVGVKFGIPVNLGR